MHSKRKLEHIEHSLSVYFKQGCLSEQRDIRYVPVELPECDLSEIDLSAVVLNKQRWSKFLYINASTGGTTETFPYLFDLAHIAKAHGLAMAVGSQSVMLKSNTQNQYHKLRQKYPKLYLMANTSLNYPWEKVKEMVEVLAADSLQVHLNLAQEAVMPEGDRDFRYKIANLQEYCAKADIPIIVKGVGYGISRETYARIAKCSPAAIDVSGMGGTNFVEVENLRRDRPISGINSWGLTALESILDLNPNVDLRQTELWASGGIYQPIQAIDCLSLGAKAIGMTTPLLAFLKQQNYQALDQYLIQFWQDTKVIMRMLGVTSIAQLPTRPLIISGMLRDFGNQRHIDLQRYANRRLQ